MIIFQETSITYIDANAFPEVSFHSFELVSMIHNASEPEFGWHIVFLMAIKEMLEFGYKLGQGLEAMGQEALLSLNSLITKEDSVWGMNPLMKNSFKLSEARRGNAIL